MTVFDTQQPWQSEYANLTDNERAILADHAEAAGDWETLSKLQVADQETGRPPDGYTLKIQRDFVDRR